MSELNAEKLYERSRVLFVDLLKLGLSLSTGIVAGLSFITFKYDQAKNLTLFQERCYCTCLICLLVAIALALTGWLAQAMYYTAWASTFPIKDRSDKWRKLRNITLSVFAFLFLTGVVTAAMFLSSFINKQ